jgi:hypothetical protein
VPPITEETAIAWHEAGHAVVSRAWDVPVKNVSIKNFPPATAYCRPRTPEEGVWITQAGRVTVMELLDSPVLAHYGAEADDQALDAFVKGFKTISEFDRVMAEVTHGLPLLVRKNRTGIERVAQDLLKKREISGKRLDEVLLGLLQPQKPPGREHLWVRIKRWFGIC